MIARLAAAAVLAAGVGYVAARVARAPQCPWCDRRHWLPCTAQVNAERADSTCHEPESLQPSAADRRRMLAWADSAEQSDPELAREVYDFLAWLAVHRGILTLATEDGAP